MKKLGALLLTFLLVLTGCKVQKIEDENDSDALKFNKEYSLVEKSNVYKYTSYAKVNEIIKTGSGIIYLGFPSCPWCKEITPVLNEIAKEKNVKEIFYYNHKDIRVNETKEYKQLVSLLSDFLEPDESGDKKIYAPTIVFVQNGIIKGIHVGSVEGHDAHERAMTEDEKKALKQIYSNLIDKVYNTDCDC
ncbi:MAG: thioredoxin family protein [Bacilli bacterium]